MAGSAAEDSSEETIIILDDGVPDTPPERSDKVLSQPPENKPKISNGAIIPMQDVENVVVDEVLAPNTIINDVPPPANTVAVINGATAEAKDQKFYRTENCWGYIREQSQPLDLSLKPLYYCGSDSNDFNYVWLVNDNVNTSKSDDDDVIFVTTYTNTTTTTTTTVQADSNTVQCTAIGVSSLSSPSPPKVVRRRRKKKVTVVPRRNPKRVAQMEKASVDLAMKLSMPKRIFTSRPKTTSDVMRNCRQSCRTTGAILSPPRALRSEDWKEWPSEGLHEKPFFNPLTKRLHRFDKNAKFIGKLDGNEICKCAIGTGLQSKPKLDDDLATLTHHCLHSVLSYVVNVKRCNRIREGAKKQYLGEFWSLFSTVADSNVLEAREVLLDTCKLYCLCNGVSETDMVRYIDSLIASDLEGTYEESK